MMDSVNFLWWMMKSQKYQIHLKLILYDSEFSAFAELLSN